MESWDLCGHCLTSDRKLAWKEPSSLHNKAVNIQRCPHDIRDFAVSFKRRAVVGGHNTLIRAVFPNLSFSNRTELHLKMSQRSVLDLAIANTFTFFYSKMVTLSDNSENNQSSDFMLIFERYFW